MILKQNDYEIEYFVYGTGKRIVFAFHGFGNDAQDFHPLEKIAGKDCTIVSVNLFFHGKSHAPDGLVEKGFSVEDLKNLFQKFFDLFPAEKYMLMGYSLGGRVVLKLAEIFPAKIEGIVLIAPDGIRISRFYRFLTQTLIGKKLFKNVIDKASIFFGLGHLLRTLRLVSEKKYLFAMNNFDTQQKRGKVFRVWMIFRKIVSKKSEMKDIIKKNDLKTDLFFGKHDQIIPASIGKGFRKGIEKQVSIYLLDSGHRMLKEKTLTEIWQIIAK